MTAPLPRPTTSPIGGGSKARFVALGVVGLLAAVVWVGFSGRPGPPHLVADASPTPSAVPSTTRPTPLPQPTERPRPTTTPLASATPTPAAAALYLINGLAGQTSFSSELREVSPGYLFGQYWLTDPQGIAWEQFHTLRDIPVFSETHVAARGDTACCAGQQAKSCC